MYSLAKKLFKHPLRVELVISSERSRNGSWQREIFPHFLHYTSDINIPWNILSIMELWYLLKNFQAFGGVLNSGIGFGILRLSSSWIPVRRNLKNS
jgi:hypothetical protein